MLDVSSSVHLGASVSRQSSLQPEGENGGESAADMVITLMRSDLLCFAT